MNSWKYRAYDSEGVVHEGTEQANDFPSLALKLRQKGLQVLEATKLHPNDVLALSRLNKMKDRIDPKPTEPAKADDGRIRRLLKMLIGLFRR